VQKRKETSKQKDGEMKHADLLPAVAFEVSDPA